MHNTHNHAKRLLAFIYIMANLCIPITVTATVCCTCYPTNNTANSVCLKDESSVCAINDIISKSGNQALKNYTCDTAPLTPEACQPVSSGSASAKCKNDPINSVSFKPATSTEQVENIPITPELNVPIPGVTFSKPVPASGKGMFIPFIAQYIQGIYKYLLGISVIVASIMMIYGGFLYIIGSTVSSVTKGKEIIKDAVIGLLLLTGSYTILNTLGPQFTTLVPIEIQKISAEEAWILENGSGSPESEKATEGLLPIPQIEPPEDSMVGGEVNVDAIHCTNEDGAWDCIKKHCASIQEAKSAKSYDEKIKLVVRAVMGFYKACVKMQKCNYCQACMVSANGTVSGIPSVRYIIDTLGGRGIEAANPENLWGPSHASACTQAWKKEAGFDQITGPAYIKKSCLSEPQALYRKLVLDEMVRLKYFGSDCGGLIDAIKACAKVKYLPQPMGKNKTTYFGAEDYGNFADLPGTIVPAIHWNEGILEKAAEKGGMKFGDIIYTTCPSGAGGYASNHYFMYTGGRSDVPFSIIEMGGFQPAGNAPFPTLGGRTINGVGIFPPGKTVVDYLNKKLEPTIRRASPSGKVLSSTPSKHDPSKCIVFVYRPWIDETQTNTAQPAAKP